MNRTLKFLANTFFLTAGLTPFASGAVYFVDSTNGSDTQSGTSMSSPWSTLARVAAAPLSPGDYVLLKRNDVWHESLNITSSGLPDMPITFGAYGLGNNPIVDGSTMVAQPNDLVVLNGQTDIVLANLQITNSQLSGINLSSGTRIVVHSVTVSSSRHFGIIAYNGNSITIENSEITGSSLDTTSSYDGIRLDGSGGETAGFIVRGCYIHNNLGGAAGWNSSNGIFVGHTGGTLPILRGVQITGNEIAFNGNSLQNQAGRGLTGTFTGDILVSNNYIHDSASAGIYLGDEGVQVAITLAQNVFYNNSLRQFGGFTTSVARAFHNATFVDNPALTAIGAEVGGSGTWEINNNSFFYQNSSTDIYRGFISINDSMQDQKLQINNNLYYSPSPDRWKMSNGVILTFPQWQSFGFDLNSVNPY